MNNPMLSIILLALVASFMPLQFGMEIVFLGEDDGLKKSVGMLSGITLFRVLVIILIGVIFTSFLDKISSLFDTFSAWITSTLHQLGLGITSGEHVLFDGSEYFFGREAEIEQMWRRLDGPSRMLAIAGPSGAGKTSFLQAGLIPHAQSGWGILRCTPGTAPINALAGALATGTAGDPEAVRQLLRFHEPEVAVEIVNKWRRGHEHAVLIVDQFEELFTLNPPEVQ